MDKYRDINFTRSLADTLTRENIPFKERAVLGGLETDFWLRTPSGNAIIIEAKSWEPTQKNKKLGIELAESYRDATGVKQGFIVIQDLEKGVPSKGLVSKKELMEILKDKFREKAVPTGPKNSTPRQKKISTPQPTERKVFAAMPFSGIYNDTYFFAMAPAADSVKAKCTRIDKVDFAGDIIEEIGKNIRESIAVIADLSESKPNILYEAGFAHGIGKPIIHICSTPLEDLPFDIKTWNTIKYDLGKVNELAPRLINRLRAILEGQ